MKTLEVNVTEQHITEGSKYKSINFCPISLAINSPPAQQGKFPYSTLASVHLTDGWFTHVEGHDEDRRLIKTRYAFKLPKIAIDFVSSLQNGEKVGPISFVLDLINKGKPTGFHGTI